jgi:predicted nuclease of predicted toxin-antitoxin system
MSKEEILADFPDLTADDISATLFFAAERERRLFSGPMWSYFSTKTIRFTHVRDIGLRGAEDRRIWDHAAERDMLLTFKDADFYQRSLMFGTPPKVVWLRIGNTSTEEVSSLLRRSHPLFYFY